MNRLVVFVYGIACYLVFFGTFLYAIGFVGNLVVPKTIDSGDAGPLWSSLAIDALLLGLFAVQHSLMARPAFKRWWTRFVPESVERSTYVLFASVALILLFAFWQPLPAPVWAVDAAWGRAMLWGIFAAGWGLVLVSTFMISHFHLFGLAQVQDHLLQRRPASPGFVTPGLYRYMRHPIMAGFFLAFWATPDMSAGHLLFAAATTGYILIALQLEEHDLVAVHGERYKEYRRRVRMFVPIGRRAAPRREEVSGPI